jgi:hypothetical protein
MSIGERNIHFFKDGVEIRPTYRGDGNYILLNTGRDNCLMQIQVFGFEPYEAVVDYSILEERLPVLDAFLIPSEYMRVGQDLLSVTGRMEGLKSIEAVHLARPLSGLREFNPKRCEMTIYMPNRRMNMVHSYYGLVNTAEQTFEEFVVLEELDDKKIRIKSPLQSEFPQNAPICRLIFGQVKPDGSYLIRVRNSGKNLKHLVRFNTEDGPQFSIIDFANPDGTEKGGAL